MVVHANTTSTQRVAAAGSGVQGQLRFSCTEGDSAGELHENLSQNNQKTLAVCIQATAPLLNVKKNKYHSLFSKSKSC